MFANVGTNNQVGSVQIVLIGDWSRGGEASRHHTLQQYAAAQPSPGQPCPGCSQASMILSQNNFYAADPSLCRLQASADEDRNKIELQTIHRISEVLKSR